MKKEYLKPEMQVYKMKSQAILVNSQLGDDPDDGNDEMFWDIVTHEYVDKSSLIPLINDTLNSEFRYSCVTRCRRFGKSMAAKMLCAYYDKSCDSRELFRGLKAEQDITFETHLNKYYVICVDMTDFTTRFRHEKEIVKIIQDKIINQPFHRHCPQSD